MSWSPIPAAVTPRITVTLSRARHGIAMTSNHEIGAPHSFAITDPMNIKIPTTRIAISGNSIITPERSRSFFHTKQVHQIVKYRFGVLR